MNYQLVAIVLCSVLCQCTSFSFYMVLTRNQAKEVSMSPPSSKFVLSLVEAFRDPSVMVALKEATKVDFDQLADMVAAKLHIRFREMQQELDEKSERIVALERKVSELEIKQDEAEQYSRRTSIASLESLKRPTKMSCKKSRQCFQG